MGERPELQPAGHSSVKRVFMASLIAIPVFLLGDFRETEYV